MNDKKTAVVIKENGRINLGLTIEVQHDSRMDLYLVRSINGKPTDDVIMLKPEEVSVVYVDPPIKNTAVRVSTRYGVVYLDVPALREERADEFRLRLQLEISNFLELLTGERLGVVYVDLPGDAPGSPFFWNKGSMPDIVSLLPSESEKDSDDVEAEDMEDDKVERAVIFLNRSEKAKKIAESVSTHFKCCHAPLLPDKLDYTTFAAGVSVLNVVNFVLNEAEQTWLTLL